MLAHLAQDSANLEIELAVIPEQMDLLAQPLLLLLADLPVSPTGCKTAPTAHALLFTGVECTDRVEGLGLQVVLTHLGVDALDDLNCSLQGVHTLVHHP